MPDDRREAAYRRQTGKWMTARQCRRWAKKGIRAAVREELVAMQCGLNAEMAAVGHNFPVYPHA